MSKVKPYFFTIALMLLFCMMIIALTTIFGTFEIGIERPPVTDEGVQRTIVAMEKLNTGLAALLNTSIASSSLTPSAIMQITPSKPLLTPKIPSSTPTPTPKKVRGLPRFSSLYFSTKPDGPPQRFFVQGIQRIYAIWNYENMDVGVVFRRKWEKDGEIWFERDSTWDMPRYGSAGILRDIYIYDFDYGLQPGKYSLTLEINGVVQKFDQNGAPVSRMEFWVVPSEILGPIVAPNKAFSIFIYWGGRLTVKDPNGDLRDLVTTDEIASVVWFPDSRHILYVERDRTKQESLESDIGITHQLWILDVVTGERHMLGSNADNFHHPVLSPNGRFIAVLSGNTYREACQASPLLQFLELDQKFQRKTTYQIADFSGLPSVGQADASIHPSNPSRPGSWETEDVFVTYLLWTCTQNSSRANGAYLLDLSKLQAERLNDQ